MVTLIIIFYTLAHGSHYREFETQSMEFASMESCIKAKSALVARVGDTDTYPTRSFYARGFCISRSGDVK